jgi:hypothetical protein
MKILFLHGWKSVPGGVKPSYLREQGHEVVNPSLDDDDYDLALRVAQEHADAHRPDVVVGSSRGGALAIDVQVGSTPRVLLCPAWRKFGRSHVIPANTFVLHSRGDDIIPFEDSEDLVADSGLSADRILEVGSDHRLADPQSLAAMEWACRMLVEGQTLPDVDDQPSRTRSRTRGSRRSARADAEGVYVCDACGEEIVIPLDVTEGSQQEYVEDCPVCCRANVIHVEIDDDGSARVWAEPEQDRD